MCYYKEPFERKQRRTENETVVFISSQFFSYFFKLFFLKIMQSGKEEIIWSYYHLSSEDQNKKNV